MSASNPSAFFNYVNDKFISINNNQDRLKQKYKNNDDSANRSKQSLYSDDNILGINDLDNYVKKNNIVFKLDPLNAKLYRLAAQISSNNENTNKANEMMAAASILSIHEVTANRYMFLINFYNNKLDTALYYADRLFSAAPEFIENYKTQMARYVQDDISRSILIKYLTHKPLWRYHFFSRVIPESASYSYINTKSFYDEMNKTITPASNSEFGYFINSLISLQQYKFAYKTWIEHFPHKKIMNNLFINNGSFETAPTGLPFDWTISSGINVNNKIVSVPEDRSKHSLQIQITRARITFPNVSEYIMLSPGKYLFQGKYRGELIGKRGLSWTVACINGQYVGESDQILGRSFQWTDFEFNFSIPEQNCEAQIVSLVHNTISTSEQIISGLLLFDDIKIGTLR